MKKLISLLLCLAMVLTVTVVAESEDNYGISTTALFEVEELDD